MSEQDVNDSMVPVASEVPGQSGAQAAPDSNVHAKPAPSMGENIFTIAALPMDDDGGEWKPLDESAWHPKELSPDMQRLCILRMAKYGNCRMWWEISLVICGIQGMEYTHIIP